MKLPADYFLTNVMSFDHPTMHSGVLPFVVAFALTGLLRFGAGSSIGPYVAGIAIPAALLLAIIGMFGMPLWPPVGSIAKWPYVVAAGLVIGFSLDLLRAPLWLARALELVGLGIALTWIAWPRLIEGAPMALVTLSLFALGCIAVLWRIAGLSHRGVEPAVMVIAAAAGVGGVALVSASLSIAQLAVALAAAVGGFALWNWPVPHLPFVATGVSGALIPVFALAMVLLLVTDAPSWALAPLFLVFYVDVLRSGLTAGGGDGARGLQAVYVVGLAALLAAAAVALALSARPEANAGLYYR